MIDVSVVTSLLTAAKSQDGPSIDIIEKANEIESVTTGVIYDG
jgi:hypothetical protein